MPTRTLFIVYGNHGKAPVHIDDQLQYLAEVALFGGAKPAFVEEPVPGGLNILIEGFKTEDVKSILAVGAVPDTRFICVVTEFLTNSTFNNFDGPHLSPIGGFNIFSNRTRRDHYPKKSQWKKRCANFCQVAEICEQIWCLDPAQMTAYKMRWGERVRLLPIVAINAEPSNPLQGRLPKDIDFLFTGTMTAHRHEVLKQLEGKRRRVVAGSSAWSGVIRNNLTARAKVCLDIRQSADWPYSSSMRLHHLLCSRAVIAVEQAANPSMQERCIGSSPTRDFADFSLDLLAKSDSSSAGFDAFQKYCEWSYSGRVTIQNLIGALAAG